ncbi:MAG: hypothetical protein J5J06_02890 [Phycisphaerae bacterium]|nr:hypothetical protein [Phycisphaerae bacterium]
MMNRARRWMYIPAAAAVALLAFGTTWAQQIEPARKRQPARPVSRKSLESDRARKPGGPAIGGYCPVSYFRDGKAVPGKEEFKLTRLGETYYFADAEARAMFEKDPERYTPRLSGWCVLTLGGPYGNRLEGDPEVFRIIDGKLYLFLSPRAMRAFDAQPAGVIEKAEQRFHQPMIIGYCPVSYFTKGKAVMGSPEFIAVYARRTYQFADAEAKAKFLADPEKYLPQYNGYCAASLIDRKKLFADPTQFSIVNGRLLLFLNAEKKAWFDEHAKEAIESADRVWALVRDRY